MAWLWGASSNKEPSNESSANPDSKDPLRHLDPSLREFLAKESPVKYSTSNPPAEVLKPNPSAAQPATKAGSASASNTQEQSAPARPSQSIFSDGRYDHLWKNYRAQQELEAAGKTDAEKVQEVLEGYKYRREQIGKAALENCALEQLEVSECFRTGRWAAKTTMCQGPNRKFNRCYNVQAKLLKALGYMSTLDRSPEMEEKIQMHADTLYQRMLSQEEAIKAAKVTSKPVPTFPPLLAGTTPDMNKALGSRGSVQLVAKAESRDNSTDNKLQQELKGRLSGLDEQEREIEKSAIVADLALSAELSGRVSSIVRARQDDQKKRLENGDHGLMDKLSNLFGGRSK